MTILNPQYSFLESDYTNSSLSPVNVKNENPSSNLQQTAEFKINVNRGLKNTIIWILLKVNPVAPILVRVPADIYCVVFLLTGEWLTF